MPMKVLGVLAVLLSLAMFVFAVMAYRELHSAATSELAPAADSMPLTKLLNPGLFDTGNTGTKPAELVQPAFNRIYIIGGGSFVLAGVGILMLVLPQAPRTGQNSS